jgi:hypothetical protein
MACTACLVCFISTVKQLQQKKKEKKPIMSFASSGHITKLKQSILRLSISMMAAPNSTKNWRVLSLPKKQRHCSQTMQLFVLKWY